MALGPQAHTRWQVRCARAHNLVFHRFCLVIYLRPISGVRYSKKSIATMEHPAVRT